MRIAFVVNNYPPRVGGVENHVASLARHLVESGHQVSVFTLHEHPGQSDEDGIAVVRWPEHARVGGILGFPALGTARKLSRALAARNIEVVSIHTRFFPMSWVGLRAARRSDVPVVHTEHGSGYVVSDSALITHASRFVDRTVGRSVLRGADAVLGVSENVIAFVERLSGRRGEVFYNAIEPAANSGPVKLRPKHLVFVGRLVPGKGWEVFVQIVAKLATEDVSVTAEVLGDGPDLEALRARVAAGGLEETIRVRGRVGPHAVRAALNGATLVNPTVLAEGFQTTLLEALAEGGRVVTYPVPGAQVLQDEGRAVRITSGRDAAELASAVRAELDMKPTPLQQPIDAWTWPERAKRYAEICQFTIGAYRAR